MNSEESIDRRILESVVKAINIIEEFTMDIEKHEIAEEDAELLCSAKNYLCAIVENNGYLIELDTKRLRRAKT